MSEPKGHPFFYRWELGIELADGVASAQIETRIAEEKARLNGECELQPIHAKFFDMLAQFLREMNEDAGPSSTMTGYIGGSVELVVKKSAPSH